MRTTKCYYDLSKDSKAYETSCGNEISLINLDNINPNYCPYCGEEICIN